MPTLSDLLRVPAVTEVTSKFLQLLTLAGFPVASWQSGSLQKHEVESESIYLTTLASWLQIVAKAGFIRLAKDVSPDWVDITGLEVFDEVRKPAVFTEGLYRLTDAGGIGPFSYPAGSFLVAAGDRERRYTNVADVTVPASGSVVFTIRAESPGQAYNAGNGELTEILTPQPGMTGTNPGGPSGTWITQQGVDREAVDAFVQRCIDKWATLGSGSNEAAYRYHATSSSPEVTRVRVRSPGAGAVSVLVAGPSGPISAAALATVAAVIEAKRPLGVPNVTTDAVAAIPLLIEGVLEVVPGKDPAAVLAAAKANVVAFLSKLEIGTRVSREKVIRHLLASDDVDDITLTSPAADVILLSDQVAVATFGTLTAVTAS